MAGPTPQTSSPTTSVPPTDMPDDSAQWAALEKELESDRTVFEQEGTEPTPIGDPEVTPPKPVETPADPDDATPDPNRPKPSYEQLAELERRKTGALKEEREARRRAEESLGAVNKLIEDLRTARQQQQPPKPTPKPVEIPDVDEDPIAHFQARLEIAERALAQAHQGVNQTAEHIQAQQQEEQFWTHVRAHEAEFRKTVPVVTLADGNQVSDYDNACEHLKAHRIAELTHMYPDNSAIAMAEARQYGLPSPAHLRAVILQNDAVGIAQRAFQLGISPAQLYYEAAKGRGYKPGGAAAAPANGKARVNPQIAAAKAGQRAALTIGGGEGRKSDNDMTISDLSDLFVEDPDEFDKQWEKMKRAGKLG